MFDFVFEITENDYRAFHMFYWYGIPQNRARMQKQKWGTVLLVFAATVVAAYVVKEVIGPLIVAGTVSLLWILTYDWQVRRTVNTSIKNQSKTGKMPYGKRSMSFEDDGFLSKDAHEEVHSDYGAIDKIGVGETAFYLFNAANSAYILPYVAFANEQEKKVFLHFIQAKAPSTAVFVEHP